MTDWLYKPTGFGNPRGRRLRSLSDLFDDFNPPVRQELQAALFETRGHPQRVAEVLNKELRSASPDSRKRALRLMTILLPPDIVWPALETGCAAESDPQMLKAFIQEMFPHPRRPIVLLSLLNNPDPSVVAATITALSACGTASVPNLPKILVELLEVHRNHQDVVRESCDALARLGTQAIQVLPRLLDLGFEKAKPRGRNRSNGAASESQPLKLDKEIVRFVLQAIAHIDPTGESLQFAIKDPKNRETFLNVIEGAFGATCGLYQRLHAVWVVAAYAGPPAGYRRMRRHEVIAYVFGPSCTDDRSRKDRLDKRFQNLLDGLRLRAIPILRQGVYDVNLVDLEALRELHFRSRRRQKKSRGDRGN